MDTLLSSGLLYRYGTVQSFEYFDPAFSVGHHYLVEGPGEKPKIDENLFFVVINGLLLFEELVL